VGAVASLVDDLREEPDRLTFAIDPRRTSLAAVVAAAVATGAVVESAGFEPPWPAQLVD
jgi:hypothetical protein